MLKKITILMTLVFLVGCNDKVNGILEVSSTTGLKDKKDRMVYIPAGAYNAQLKFKKKKAELKIETHDGERKFKFKHPYKKSLGENFGIRLDSRVSGQPVDVTLSRETTRDYSDRNTYRDRESCSKSVRVNRWDVVKKRDGKKVRVCKTYNVNARGSAEIEYERVYKAERTTVEMYRAGTSAYRGGMDTTENSVERNITHRGRCYLDRRPRNECGGRGRGR